jgi:hypothetical protein
MKYELIKYELIKTEDYLLVVDKNEWDGNNVLAETKLLDKNLTIHNFQPNKGDRKILAHIPLNGSLYLDGVDVLPEIEYDLHIYDAIAYAGSEGHPDPHAFSERQAGLLIGYADGFEKAKETYKYTEEDMIEFAVWRSITDFDEPHTPLGEFKIWESINQPKLPVAFECYYDNILSHNADDGIDALVNPNFGEPKTFTNSEGRTEWFGKYLF